VIDAKLDRSVELFYALETL